MLKYIFFNNSMRERIEVTKEVVSAPVTKIRSARVLVARKACHKEFA